MPPVHVYNPDEWNEFQQRLISNHRDIWRAVKHMDYADAVPYLNTILGTTVPADALLRDAGRIFLNALLKREGTIVLVGGKGYSK